MSAILLRRASGSCAFSCTLNSHGRKHQELKTALVQVGNWCVPYVSSRCIPFISTTHWLLLGPAWKKQEFSPVLFDDWDKTPNTSGDWWGLHPLHLQSKVAHLCRRCFNPAGQDLCRLNTEPRLSSHTQQRWQRSPSHRPGPLLHTLEIQGRFGGKGIVWAGFSFEPYNNAAHV